MSMIPSTARNPELQNPTLEEQEAWYHEGGLREALKEGEERTVIHLARIIHHLTKEAPWIVSVQEMALTNARTSTVVVSGPGDKKLCDEMTNRRRLLVANIGANAGLISPYTISNDQITSMGANGDPSAMLVLSGQILPPMLHQHEMFCASLNGATFAVIEELL